MICVFCTWVYFTTIWCMMVWLALAKDRRATQEQVGVLRAKSFTFPFSLMLLLRVAGGSGCSTACARLSCVVRFPSKYYNMWFAHRRRLPSICSERSEITSLLTISVMMVTLSVIMCAVVYLPDDDGGWVR